MTTRVKGSVAPNATEVYMTSGESVEDAINSGTGGTGGTGGLRIAVIGDSLVTQNTLHETSWPAQLERYVNNSGGSCRVQNFGINSFTFNKANTLTTHDGKTARQALIDFAPNVVLCTFGVVDVLAQDEGRTLAQNQASAQEFYSTVRAALPSAILCHIQVSCHDRTYGNLSGLKNKHVIPYFYQLRSSGLLQGLYSSEIMDDNVSATTQTRFNEGEAFHTYIGALPEVDHLLRIDYWRIARLGLMGVDGLHPVTLGKLLMCGYVIKELRAKQVHPMFTGLADKNYPSWEDPDNFFTTAVSGPDWTFNYFGPNGVEYAGRLNSYYREFNPDLWMYPYKTSVTISRTEIGAGQPFQAMFLNGAPNQEVLPSIDGGAFDTNNPSVQLDINGNGGVAVIDPVPEGVYQFRYKIGPEVHGPYQITFVAGGGGGGGIGVTPITEGGTGATTASGARNNLGTNDAGNLTTGTVSTSRLPTIPVTKGGTGATSAASARSTLGINQSGPFAASLLNSWVPTLDYETPGYMKDHNGRVFLQGAAKGGTSERMFTLPVGYRPNKNVGFVVPVQGVPQVMLVKVDGEVEFSQYNFGSSEIAFIDGVSFMSA